jgi:4-alpha-glucanotransferase
VSGARAALPQELSDAAAAAGVATSYENWAHQRVDVAPEAVRIALAALGGAPAAGPAATLVTRDGSWPETGRLHLETGSILDPGAPVPLGYHQLERADGSVATVISAPPRVPQPRTGRVWGWAVQLYAMRSGRSWGIGDYEDLAVIAEQAAGQGADAVLVNPLHALAPVLPIERSPYSPSSRRMVNALAIAIDRLPEYAAATPALQARIAALRPPQRALIDHDEVWRAKSAALDLLAPSDLAVPQDDPSLLQWSVFAALSERLGPDWRLWPQELQVPGAAASAAADQRRVAVHAWVQQRCSEQLRSAQQRARAAGMRIGLVHDLAVGVHPGGADSWALADDLVRGVTVGAPPDGFNQLGQDWALPPFHPGRLAGTGYAAFRDVVRATLRHAGGLRVDHVMGLWRLWWVPEGRTADAGTYVRYDADAMLAVLALEAERAGALLVGEDLGTVEPAVAQRVAAEDLLGCDVLWFATSTADDETPLPPQEWREQAVASISTHDLPTAAGWLAGEPARVRAALGLLGVPLAQEEARLAAEQRRWLGLLRAEGLLASEHDDPAPEAVTVVRAMHALLARARSRLALVAFGDATGDLRQPNMPGTVPGRSPYPSWAMPVADHHGRPLGLETLAGHPEVARVARLLDARVESSRDTDDSGGHGVAGVR